MYQTSAHIYSHRRQKPQAICKALSMSSLPAPGIQQSFVAAVKGGLSADNVEYAYCFSVPSRTSTECAGLQVDRGDIILLQV